MEFLKETFPGQVISGQKKIIFNAGVESSINYAEPSSEYSPRIQLLFSPFGVPFIPIEIVGTKASNIVRSLNWTKDRNNPGGLFQATITPDTSVIQDIVDTLNKVSGNLYSKIWGELGVDLEDLFKPMTLTQLWLDGYHVATGYVRSCSRSASVTNESKDVSYTIVVEELGNLYNLSTTSLDYILKNTLKQQIVDSLKSAMATTANIKGVSIAQGLQAVLTAFQATTLKEYVTLSDGFPLAYRLQALPNPLGGLSNTGIANFMTIDSSMYELNGGNSVWNFMKSFVPSPWMELFTESGGRTIVTDGFGAPSVLFPGFAYPVSRTTPYSNPLLGIVNPKYLAQTIPFDLNAIQMLAGGDFVIVTDEMISEKNIGVDSINQNTVFHTKYTGAGNTSNLIDKGIKSVGPLNPFASGGVSTFGIREMFQTINWNSLQGLGVGSSYVENIIKNTIGLPGLALSTHQLSNLLAVWFRNQSRFREGSITTAKPIPWARVGMYCLYLPSISGKKVDNIRDIGIYYIDSVNHNYALDDEQITCNTTLNVIRGVPLPNSLAKTAMLLFDFEVLPPESGLFDGEYTILKNLKFAL